MRSDDKKNICLGCGAEFASGQRFCKKCGKALRRICPQCHNDFSLDAKFCMNCGYKFPEDIVEEGLDTIEEGSNNSKEALECSDSKRNESDAVTDENAIPNNNINPQKILIILAWVVFALILAIIGFEVFKYSMAKLTDINKVMAPDCEADTSKELVIDIFKDNNEFYKAINSDSIADISVMYPAITSYDKDIDKYNCTATIVMTAAETGFTPVEYDSSNKYYNKINDSWSDYETLQKYTVYKVDVKYDTQLSEDRTLVHSQEVSGNFSCEGDCGRIDNQKYIQEKIEHEKEVAQQNQEIAEEEQKIKSIYGTSGEE